MHHLPLAAEFSNRLDEAWAGAADVVPRLAAFAAVLLVGFVVAFVLRSATNAMLEAVGFDRAVERGGVRRALSRVPYDASDVLARIVFWAVVLFTLQLAFGVFGPNAVSDALKGLIAYLPKVFAAVLIVVLTAALAGFVRELVDVAIGRLSYGRTVANAAGTAILAIGVFAALTQLEVAPAIVVGLFYALLAAIVGVVVVAVGGAGIVPLRSRWERTLTRWDDERDRLGDELGSADRRIAEHRRARDARHALQLDIDLTDEPVPAGAARRADPAGVVPEPVPPARHAAPLTPDGRAALAQEPRPAPGTTDMATGLPGDPTMVHEAPPTRVVGQHEVVPEPPAGHDHTRRERPDPDRDGWG